LNVAIGFVRKKITLKSTYLQAQARKGLVNPCWVFGILECAGSIPAVCKMDLFFAYSTFLLSGLEVESRLGREENSYLLLESEIAFWEKGVK
jgi:hypothetical protein